VTKQLKIKGMIKSTTTRVVAAAGSRQMDRYVQHLCDVMADVVEGQKENVCACQTLLPCVRRR